MRLMGFLFLCLTFLAGITVGTVEIALINIVVFLGLALLAERFLAPRFGKNGLVFGMAGAFFVSCMWPAVVHAARDKTYCDGDDCPPKEPEVTVTISTAP
ncbi:hypothetical protein C0V72_06715 [Porphyrobacter sp. TH134]|uniref:hypothetical protein n=1 Tax=Porphyrobacter sp. TH134 TaxID=2067450 RepID=UPI000C795C28|nr:hypothetical protein [Porphyrobacter sp. TH134]PLK24060.1 hypothetical protein C0V72_06715 [Porphyrobacter sp. TH134]